MENLQRIEMGGEVDFALRAMKLPQHQSIIKGERA
jgi:hypothetical protein